MSLQAKAFYNLLGGAAAGLLACLSAGPASPYLPLVYGAMLGLFLGTVETVSQDSSSRKVRAQVWGVILGVCGGGLGLMAPAFSWPFIGAFVGMTGGAAKRAPRLARQGALGGFAGGLLGGGAFGIAALAGSDEGTRLLAFTLSGTLTGYCIGLAPDLFKHAWLHVLVGPGAGKDYLIAKARVRLGRDGQSDVGVFGDPSVAPTHAVIECLPGQNRHRLRHVAGGQGAHAYPPTLVNGRSVTAEHWLTDGDTLQIGRVVFRFHEKSTQPAIRPMTPHVPPAPSAAPTLVLTSAPAVSMPDVPPVPPAAAGGRGARLTAISGPYTGQSFPLSHRTVTVGRAADRESRCLLIHPSRAPTPVSLMKEAAMSSPTTAGQRHPRQQPGPGRPAPAA